VLQADARGVHHLTLAGRYNRTEKYFLLPFSQRDLYLSTSLTPA
jgi:hypothetical protein